jgi:antitoxin component of RelBE/YafQ-DinJ toxin-antitoxin module
MDFSRSVREIGLDGSEIIKIFFSSVAKCPIDTTLLYLLDLNQASSRSKDLDEGLFKNQASSRSKDLDEGLFKNQASSRSKDLDEG